MGRYASPREKQCAALVGRAACLAVLEPREKQHIALTEVGGTAGNALAATPPPPPTPASSDSAEGAVPGPTALTKVVSGSPTKEDPRELWVKGPPIQFTEPASRSPVLRPSFPTRTADGREVTKLVFPAVSEDGNRNPPSRRQASQTTGAPHPPPQTQAQGLESYSARGAAVSAPNVHPGAQYDEESKALEAIARGHWNEERARKQGVIVFQSSLFSRFRAGGFEAPEQVPGTALVKLSKNIQSSRACVLPRSYVLNAKDRASAESYYEFHGNGDEIVKIMQVAIHISEGGFSDVLKGYIQMG